MSENANSKSKFVFPIRQSAKAEQNPYAQKALAEMLEWLQKWAELNQFWADKTWIEVKWRGGYWRAVALHRSNQGTSTIHIILGDRA